MVSDRPCSWHRQMLWTWIPFPAIAMRFELGLYHPWKNVWMAHQLSPSRWWESSIPGSLGHQCSTRAVNQPYPWLCVSLLRLVMEAGEGWNCFWSGKGFWVHIPGWPISSSWCLLKNSSTCDGVGRLSLCVSHHLKVPSISMWNNDCSKLDLTWAGKYPSWGWKAIKGVFVEMVVAIRLSLIVIVTTLRSTVTHHVVCAGRHAGCFTLWSSNHKTTVLELRKQAQRG